MTRYLAKRRPGGSGGDILAAAAAAAKMCANIGNREGRAELGDEDGDRHHGIMPATVAPTEDPDVFLLQLAEDRRVPPSFFLFQVLLLHTSHRPFRPVVPSIDRFVVRFRKAVSNYYETGRKKNITGTFSDGQE
jgi:hypothetical protein